jgi:glyceraldehyde-3-phosphate dehydrogenase/erythrose-4-phosphate dehydrogenase
MAKVVKVGINGFGRIGRLVFRVLLERKDQFEVVGINDLFDSASMAYTLKFDSTHGRYPGTVTADGTNLVVDGRAIPLTAVKSPQEPTASCTSRPAPRRCSCPPRPRTRWTPPSSWA